MQMKYLWFVSVFMYLLSVLLVWANSFGKATVHCCTFVAIKTANEKTLFLHYILCNLHNFPLVQKLNIEQNLLFFQLGKMQLNVH